MAAETEWGEVVVERPRLVTYELDADEPVMDGLTTAFDAIGYDLAEQDPPLIDYVDPDAIEELRRNGSDFRLAVSIWQHPVSFTPHQITIYESGAWQPSG